NMSMRWRGHTMRRMSLFPSAEPAPLAPTEDALQKEMENEEQKLVKELVDMSTRERIHAIRDLPMSFEEKKSIRWVGRDCQRRYAFSSVLLSTVSSPHPADDHKRGSKVLYAGRKLNTVMNGGLSRVAADHIRHQKTLLLESTHGCLCSIHRSQVLAFKSANQSPHFTGFRDFTENASVTLRSGGYSVRSARQTLQLWQGTMKEIGGRFGTSVLTYFMFLKWLLVFNVVSFLINFGFITIPLLVHDHTPNLPPNVNFRGLEILTGAGYFNYTVMYYGSYSNETLVGLGEYNLQLAYFFTISVYMVLCGVALIFSMAKSFKENYVLSDPASSSAWQILCSWDLSIVNERAITQRKNNLSVQLKESLSEGAQTEMLTRSEKMKHFGIHLGSWLLSTSLAFGCGSASIFSAS
ncbi:unnamed protein product, partial [Tetraodon nigroviridis]